MLVACGEDLPDPVQHHPGSSTPAPVIRCIHFKVLCYQLEQGSPRKFAQQKRRS